MDAKHPKSPAGLSQKVLKVVQNAFAITAAINEMAKNDSTENGDFQPAFHVDMANSEPEVRSFMDATALREQTIANINAIYDLFYNHQIGVWSAPKLITAFSDGKRFTAAMVRTLTDRSHDGYCGLMIIIKAENCNSGDEALRKLYRFSQSVLSLACKRSGNRGAFMDPLAIMGGHDWDEGCVLGEPLDPKAVGWDGEL